MTMIQPYLQYLTPWVFSFTLAEAISISRSSLPLKNLLCLHIQNWHPNWNRSKLSDKLLGHTQLLSFFPFIYVAEGSFAICFNFFCSQTQLESCQYISEPLTCGFLCWPVLFSTPYSIISDNFSSVFSLCKICLFQAFFAPLTPRRASLALQSSPLELFRL